MKIDTIWNEVQDRDNDLVDNRIFLGLWILNNYASKEVIINPAHDEIWAGLPIEEYEKMTEEDIRRMFELGWRWEDESFVIFS